MDILHSQVNTPGADRLAQTIVGIIEMMREILLPAPDQAGRNRLCAYMHQSPLGKIIILKPHLSAFDSIQQILRPRDQKPYNGNLLFRYGFENPFRFNPTEQNRFAACHQTAKPVHFSPGMIEWRNTEKVVFTGLAMVLLFSDGRRHQAGMRMQNSLGKTGGSRRKVNNRIILVIDFDLRLIRAAVGSQAIIVFCKNGTILSSKEKQLYFGQLFINVFHAADKFRSEYQGNCIG